MPASHFLAALGRSSPKGRDRRWLYVPYDQLSDGIGPLAREPAESLGIVLIESSWKAQQRPYHRQKLALVLSNQRHFALEQAERGVAVRYLFTRGPYAEALDGLGQELGSLRVMEPAERELRKDVEPLVESGLLELMPHEGWLTTRDQFDGSRTRSGGYRMDSFYRLARRERDLLMSGDKPLGGRWSFDSENRKPWKGRPAPPQPPLFEVDAITREVGRLVEQRFASHPGELHLERLPSTRDDAERLWSWARESCLEHFGPYEDAMSTRSPGLFHTRVSALLNLHRLLPKRLVEEAARLDAPLASREGFVRQVLGWREFVRWMHVVTDGFRDLPEPFSDGSRHASGPGGADPSFLGSRRPLPPAFWGKSSGLHCLDRVVADVWREGYSHHITRLMVLSNVATLLDVSPRELTDWFWVAYTDAFDWVVEPNVLGMGTFATGELMVTKPYVSGANYIHRMSDYCGDCAFDPKKDCPMSSLYWQFLERHRDRLEGNPRMSLALASSARRREKRGAVDRRVFDWVSDRLAAGERLSPEEQPDEVTP